MVAFLAIQSLDISTYPLVGPDEAILNDPTGRLAMFDPSIGKKWIINQGYNEHGNEPWSQSRFVIPSSPYDSLSTDCDRQAAAIPACSPKSCGPFAWTSQLAA